MYLLYKDELYHHGIKGQKWGLRRFQNEDGSLTAAGRERYIFSDKDKTRYEKLKKKHIKNAFQAQEQVRLYNKKKRLSNLSKADMDKEIKDHDAKVAERQAKIKKAVKIGAAVAATALVAYGAYKVSEAIKDKNRIEAGKRAAMNLYNANAPTTTYARQSKLDGKVYYKMKNAYGDTIQKGSAKDFDSYRKIVSDRQWEATQQHAKAIRDLQAKKHK